MSKIETILLCLSLACNVYLLISLHLQLRAVQIKIKRAVAKLLELTKE